MLISLSIATLLTAAISGFTGMAGGVLLLSIMTFFLPLNVIIPVHGMVQLVSNFSRTALLYKYVNRKVVLYFTLGLPIGAFISVAIYKLLSREIPYTLLSIIIFYAVFKPKKLPSLKIPNYGFFLVGLACGFLGPLIGTIGPFIAPFMIRDDFSKNEIVSTKSALQLLTHVIKFPAFLVLGFNYNEHLSMIIILSVCAIIGTFAGVTILGKLKENIFRNIFKILLVISAVRILYNLYVA
jgi:uncharacterized membrane protein YfcA